MANSKIGFHYSVGGNKTGIGNWISRANGLGIPVGLKGASDYGLLHEASQYNGNWLVYRHVASTTGLRETPNYTVAPWDDAQELCQQIVAILPPEFNKAKVWIEPINEPRGKTNPGDVFYNNMAACDYLGTWMLAAAQYLNARGYKCAGPSFNSGEPGEDGHGTADAVVQYSQPGMLSYLAYCADNPTMAALAVHDYVWDLTPPQYPQLWGRWEAAIAAADMAGIPRTFPIFVTEFGFSLDDAPTYPDVEPHLDTYNQICARFPQLKFAASWTLQAGYDNISNKLITWINYPIEKEFDEGPQPAKTHDIFGGTLPGGTIMDTRSFEKPWRVITSRLQEPADFQLSVITAGNTLWYPGGDVGVATGTVEALHKGCDFDPPTLPPEECVGGIRPLVLEGQRCYKIQAVSMASGTSLTTTFQGTGRSRIMVPVQVHWQVDVPNEPDDVYVAIIINGRLEKLLQHPELKDRTWHYIVAEADLPATVELRFQTSYRNSRDLFTDYWTEEEIPMPECRGEPRVQYTRRYNVIPQDATEAQAVAVFLEGWRRNKETSGGSYDDAGLGDLNNRVANLYGIPEAQRQIYLDWYAQHYPGVFVDFKDFP